LGSAGKGKTQRESLASDSDQEARGVNREDGKKGIEVDENKHSPLETRITYTHTQKIQLKYKQHK